MEFSFDVNKVLPNEITLIRSKDIILDASKGNMNRERDIHAKLNLTKVIDVMGIASGKAQNLRGAITSALRMKSSDHHLYLLKEASGNNGLGCVIGMLRVGFKHLFLVDTYGQQHECHPLCLLDFFVHESKQRHGYGKKMFNYMIRSENIHPHELAIDRPSVKSINFLSRHYSLEKPINQLNKFLVFAAFFKDMSAVGGINAKSRRSAPAVNRNLHNINSFQQDRRYCASATVNKLHQKANRPHQPEYSLSRQISVLPPIHSNNLTGGGSEDINLYQKPMTTSRQSDRMTGRSNFPQNLTNDVQVRSFSRHHVERSSSKSSPNLPLKTSSSSSLSSSSTTTTTNLEKNHEQSLCNNKLETHTLQTCHKVDSQQLTSLDNPCSKLPVSNEDHSYTVNKVINKINNNRERLGTSWNVFGVPNNSSVTSNPYSSMKRRGFLS